MIRLAVLAAVAAIGLASVACSADRPSNDLKCDNQSDCRDGRMCDDGYCVYDENAVDAGVDADDRCPSVCTSCTGLYDDAGGFTTCVVECDGNGSCNDQIECPPGMICEVTCSGNSACDGGVDCGSASECHVDCSGVNACGDGVECGFGACTVTCTGPSACDRGVDCNASCACDVSCDPNACDAATDCISPTCEDGNNGCDPAGAGCSFCP